MYKHHSCNYQTSAKASRRVYQILFGSVTNKRSVIHKRASLGFSASGFSFFTGAIRQKNQEIGHSEPKDIINKGGTQKWLALRPVFIGGFFFGIPTATCSHSHFAARCCVAPSTNPLVIGTFLCRRSWNSPWKVRFWRTGPKLCCLEPSPILVSLAEGVVATGSGWAGFLLQIPLGVFVSIVIFNRGGPRPG